MSHNPTGNKNWHTEPPYEARNNVHRTNEPTPPEPPEQPEEPTLWLDEHED